MKLLHFYRLILICPHLPCIIQGTYVIPRPRADFYSVECVGGGGPSDPPAVRPLMELDLREKNERVALNESKPMETIF